MKKHTLKSICIACASVLTLSISPLLHASAGSNQFRIMGDADGDGAVSVADAQSVLVTYVKCMSQNMTLDAAEDPSSDTNLDGVIDLLDANNILQFYCRTLAGDKPLWAEYRQVTHHEGSLVLNEKLTREVGPDGKYIYTHTQISEPTYFSFGRPGMFLEIGVASGKPGDYVKVPVYLSGTPEIAAFQLFINKSGNAELVDIHLYGCREARSAESDFDCYGVTNPDPYWGASAWVAPGGKNVTIKDGSVIAEYVYHIPEDAVPGTVYSLSVLQEETRFVTNGSELTAEDYEYNHNKTYYQYTLLDGAIYVE